MQHIKRAILISALFMAIFIFSGSKTYAAINLPANEKTVIKFKKAQQTKKIVFTMPENGYVQFWITPKDIKTVNGYWARWNCSLKYQGTICENNGFSINTNSSDTVQWVTRKTGLYSLKKGGKITLTFESSNRDFAYINKMTLYAKVTTPKNFEIENNGTKNKATSIKYKKKNSGIVSGKESDYWVFTAPKTKNYSFKIFVNNDKLKNQYFLTNTTSKYSTSSKGDSCLCQIYDSSFKKLLFRAIHDYDGTITFGPYKLRKGEKYYIQMYNSSQALYNIKIK
mgnify:CR=1 FL=1